jgi:4-hydroxybenzoate polyprenyltransferase
VFSFFRLVRPRQWLKNLFCLAGVIFAGRAVDPHSFGRAWLAVIAFCAVSSCVYVLNDVVDRDRDALHPKKRTRPIASGAVSIRLGAAAAVVALVVGLGMSAYLGVSVLAITLAYLLLNVAYSLILKRIVIVDVLIVAAGFILRIFAGAEAVSVPVSAWILLCTFFLALFPGFAKRRAELGLMRQDPAVTRSVLVHYDEASLDTFTAICATLAIATYALFTTAEGHERSLVITCPPVAFAIFRYLLRCRQGAGESTDAVLVHDRTIQVAIAIWIGLYVWVLYGGLRLNLQ